MSEVMTREEFDELARDIYSHWRHGEPVDNEHLIEEYIAQTDALLDAHDAALERESAYRYMLHHVLGELKELNAASHEDLIASVGNFLQSTKTWEDALAATRTPDAAGEGRRSDAP